VISPDLPETPLSDSPITPHLRLRPTPPWSDKAFKARVASEALKGARRGSELAVAYEVDPTMIHQSIAPPSAIDGVDGFEQTLVVHLREDWEVV
jgi:hypothetical protein